MVRSNPTARFKFEQTDLRLELARVQAELVRAVIARAMNRNGDPELLRRERELEQRKEALESALRRYP